MAIDNGCSKAMYNLGVYYEEIEKDYDLMKKYFLMAIDKGYSGAMDNLGRYYQLIEKNYDLMKRYYLMAIDKGEQVAMFFLGMHYKIKEKDSNLMKKYFFMAIDKDADTYIIYHLEDYYEEHNLFVEKINDLYQHNIEITEDHITEMFTKCKITDDKLMNLIQNIDLRSYKNCPEHIKSMQNNYIQSIKNELNACNKCPKELVNLTIDFIITGKK